MDPRAVATVTTCVLEIERKESNSWWDGVDNWQKKASSQVFYLKGADPENCRREKKGLVMTLLCIPCMHTGAQKPACRHTPKHHYFSWHFPLLSFPVPLLHRLRRRQRMSLCRLSSCSIQWCSPDTSHVRFYSSNGFEPKQGVAIPLPACLLLSAYWSTVEEQVFEWTGWGCRQVDIQRHNINCCLIIEITTAWFNFTAEREGADDGGQTMDTEWIIYVLVCSNFCRAV